MFTKEFMTSSLQRNFGKRMWRKPAWQKSAGTRLLFFSRCIGDSSRCPWMSRCSESIHWLFVIIAFASLPLLLSLISSRGFSTGFCMGISEKECGKTGMAEICWNTTDVFLFLLHWWLSPVSMDESVQWKHSFIVCRHCIHLIVVVVIIDFFSWA